MALIRAAGFIVFRRRLPGFHPEFLLLQTSYGQHHWTPPKGHVDPGEDDFQTALRETREEAGLLETDLVVIPDFKVELRYSVTPWAGEAPAAARKPKLVTYWLAELREDRPVVLSEEHQALRWACLPEAVDLCGFPDMAEALKKCQQKILGETPTSSLD